MNVDELEGEILAVNPDITADEKKLISESSRRFSDFLKAHTDSTTSSIVSEMSIIDLE
jgi:hypothetical protein